MKHAFSFALLALALACAPQARLRPGPGAMAVEGKRAAATASVSGVSVVVDAASWTGTPERLETVLPVKVTIENRGSVPVRVQYRDFSLMATSGARLAALPPFSIRGTEFVYRGIGGSGFDPYVPGFLYDRFWLAPPWSRFYPQMSPWGGPYFYDPLYYDTYYARWPVELPTRDMVVNALPEGVIEPGGRLSGFVFFQPLPAGTREVTFRQDIANASTGEELGTVQIPFVNPAS